VADSPKLGSGAGEDEVRALVRLTFDEIARGVGGIGQIHGAVADRVFTRVGTGGVVARAWHDTISAGVYTGLGGCSSALGRAAARALPARGTRSERSLSHTPLGGGLLGVIDGLIGDQLERQQSVLSETMSVRVHGRVVECRRDALARAFPRATGRLVVFVHGLMGTEFPWDWYASQHGGTYGKWLSRDLGLTPVYIRYNTGRHISENGVSLADLLERVAAA
jgi:hypothetical protein